MLRSFNSHLFPDQPEDLIVLWFHNDHVQLHAVSSPEFDLLITIFLLLEVSMSS